MTEQLVELPAFLRIRTRFITMQQERHDRLEELLAATTRGRDPEAALKEARSILHTIGGTAGSLGFDVLGSAAGRVELLIDAHFENGSEDVAAIAAEIDAFLDISLDTIDPSA